MARNVVSAAASVCLGCNARSLTLYCDGCAPPSRERAASQPSDWDLLERQGDSAVRANLRPLNSGIKG